MIKRAGAGILSGVILAAALSCSLSGCNTVQNQTEHQTEQKTEQEVSQAAQGENQVSGIEFRLQYPQAMWQGLNLTYADYGNEEEFERKFHNAVQKITGLTGNADWYTKYNPKAVYIRVLIKIADMSYRSIGGQCDWPIVDAADGLFTTVYMDKDMQEAGQPTLEHELTHMLFALLTFHPPVSLDVNQNKGGYFAFKGKGNWLIAIAPYFFPTFGFVVMLASIAYIVMGEKIPDMYWSVLGVMVGYHLASTILEIHPKQTDFKVAGYLFTLLFLPGANLIIYGILLSFASLGWKGVDVYFNVLNHQTHELLMRFMS